MKFEYSPLMLWLVQKLVDYFWPHVDGTVRLPILLAKWLGCQCSLCL